MMEARLTLITRDGLSPIRLSNTFKSPDNDNDTISSAPLQVLPTCWSLIAAPRVQVFTALRFSTSPI